MSSEAEHDLLLVVFFFLIAFLFCFVDFLLFFLLLLSCFLPHCCEAVAVPEAGYGRTDICCCRCRLKKFAFFFKNSILHCCEILSSWKVGAYPAGGRTFGRLYPSGRIAVVRLTFSCVLSVCVIFLLLCVLFCLTQVLCFAARRAWISV